MGNLCAAKQDLSPEEAARRKAEQQQSKELDRKLNRENDAMMAVHKLLLLGAGESGKSTLFKQMIAIYGNQWPEKERLTFVSTVHNNVLTNIKTLIEQSEVLSVDPHNLNTRLSPDLDATAQEIGDLKMDAPLDADLGAKISKIWHDPGIQLAYEHRSKFQLADSAQYFFDKLDEITKPEYIPSEQDVLRCRVRTTGIVEQEFKIQDNIFRMCDVGGQRNERKKWIHCFEGVTAVLFVAALSEYDMVCFEDESKNRMDEALELFQSIASNPFFEKSTFILFLNKKDLLEDKIKRVPLNVWQPNFPGPDTYEGAVEFIQKQFEKRYRNHELPLFVHICCATDKDLMRRIFASVRSGIIQRGLAGSSLL